MLELQFSILKSFLTKKTLEFINTLKINLVTQ